MLAEKLHGGNVNDKEVSERVRSSVAASPGLRDKADLIEAFDKGGVPDQGTAVGKILKPASRFAKGNSYGERRRAALDSLWAFYGRYRSLTNSYPPATEFGTSGGETGDDIS